MRLPSLLCVETDRNRLNRARFCTLREHVVVGIARTTLVSDILEATDGIYVRA